MTSVRRPAHRFRAGGARAQRGYLLLMLTATLVLTLVAILVGSLSSAAVQNKRNATTADALAQAKEALIGYALARRSSASSPNARPGELPCPDRDNDGDDDGSCNAGEIGRVPWRSLGLAPPLGGAAETIWYAIAGPFRNRSMNPNPINSGSRGDLVVYAPDGVTVQANDVVFILFAAGPALAGQSRSAAAGAICPYDSTNKPANLCPNNYLDTGDPDGTGPAPVRSNATEGGPFIAPPRSALFNDQLRYVRTDEFIRRLEQSVGREALKWLDEYRTANGKLPFPAAANDPLCVDGPTPATVCRASSDVCSGRFPESAAADNGGVPEPEFAPPLTDPTRAWFINGQWAAYIAYATGTSQLAAPLPPTVAPTGCGPSVTLNGTARAALLVMPGSRPALVIWPSVTLSDYLEDAANQDAWSIAPGFQDFASPSGLSNDRILSF